MSTEDFVVKEAINDVLESCSPGRMAISSLVAWASNFLDRRGYHIENDVIRRAIIDGCNTEKWLHNQAPYGVMRMSDYEQNMTGANAVRREGCLTDTISLPQQMSEKQKEIRFFGAVALGNCPCNTLKSLCPTHKDL